MFSYCEPRNIVCTTCGERYEITNYQYHYAQQIHLDALRRSKELFYGEKSDPITLIDIPNEPSWVKRMKETEKRSGKSENICDYFKLNFLAKKLNS